MLSRYVFILACALVMLFDAVMVASDTITAVDRSKHLASKTNYQVPSESFKTPSSTGTCTPKQVNLVCRHGSRYPTKKRLLQMIQLSQQLQQRTKQYKKTLKPEFEWLKTWIPEFVMEKEGQLTELGINELDDLGERFVAAFPGIFGGYDPSEFRIRSTQQSRAGRSATSFAFGAWNAGRQFDRDGFIPPFVTTTGPLGNDAILRFYDVCPAYTVSKKSEQTLSPLKEFMARVGPSIVNRMNAKVGIDLFDTEQLDALWIACQSELSTEGSSLMCSLFDDEAVLDMELASDIDEYWEKGYGVALNYRMSCPLTEDLRDSLTGSGFKADLRFAHAETVIPLLAVLGLYRDNFVIDAKMTSEQIESRLWRTSSIATFSMNIAFVTYECEQDSSTSKFVAVYHNERLMTVPACDNAELCALEKFVHVLQPQGEQCHLKSLCQVSAEGSRDNADTEDTTPLQIPSVMNLQFLLGIAIGFISSFAFFSWQG